MKKIDILIKESLEHMFSIEDYKYFRKQYKKAIKNSNVKIKIKRIEEINDWYLTEDSLEHRTGRFFKVKCIDVKLNSKEWQQPIIDQNEVGIIALIGTIKDKKLRFLIQLKVEPGNINHIQLAPTIQATRSNYENVHKGKQVKYISLINELNKNDMILLDSKLSEQNSRFICKKNRNLIKIIDSDRIISQENFIWLSIGQIKELSLIDNLINMDLRSILSGLSLDSKTKKTETDKLTQNIYLNQLTKYNKDEIKKILNKLAKYIDKQIRDINFIKMKELCSWTINEGIIKSKYKKNFQVIGAEISVKGREVKRWDQPMIKSEVSNHNVLFYYIKNNSIYVYVQFKNECGSRQIAEIGPSIQTSNYNTKENHEKYLYDLYELNVINNRFTVKQSEEGGRFFREENINVLQKISDKQRDQIKETINSNRYYWIELCNIIYLIKSSGPVNMQLRGIIAMMSSELLK